MTSLTEWLLRAFADEWPGGLPADLALKNRDDSAFIDPDTSTDPTTLNVTRRSEEADLSVANILGVATTDWQQNPSGLGGGEYRTEPVLSVRIEGAHTDRHGHVADADAFSDLALTATEVVQNIDNGTLQAAPVAGFYVAEPENPNPEMFLNKDYYSWQFDVRPRGYRTV